MPHGLDHIHPSDLPSPPQPALQIIDACAQETVTAVVLARLVSTDPLLTAEILRMVNSSYYGLSGRVDSIQRAVTVLGQQSLRNMVLCVAIREAIGPDRLPGVDLDLFWEDALREAVTVRLLAQHLRLDADRVFTAALLQRFAYLVLIFLHSQQKVDWQQLRGLDPAQTAAEQNRLFGTRMQSALLVLGQQWSLPDELIKLFDDKDIDADLEPIKRVQVCAAWMACVFCSDDAARVLHTARKQLSEHWQMPDTAMDDLFRAIPESLREAGSALGVTVEAVVDFDTVLKRANLRLAADNLSYQELTWKLQETLRERDELAAQLNRELTWAREIQQSLMPRPQPELPVAGINLSARQLSGDFFDYYRLDEHRLFFCLGDVSGKGVNAAMLMAKTSSLLRCLGRRIESLSELFSLINDQLCETSVRGMFVTAVAGVLDQRTQQVSLVNAGHPPPLLLRYQGEVRSIPAQGPPLGVLLQQAFPCHSFSLQDAELCLYTDGVTEAKNAGTEEYGVKRLAAALVHCGAQALPERLPNLTSGLQEQGFILHDDATLLLVAGAHG